MFSRRGGIEGPPATNNNQEDLSGVETSHLAIETAFAEAEVREAQKAFEGNIDSLLNEDVPDTEVMQEEMDEALVEIARLDSLLKSYIERKAQIDDLADDELKQVKQLREWQKDDRDEEDKLIDATFPKRFRQWVTNTIEGAGVGGGMAFATNTTISVPAALAGAAVGAGVLGGLALAYYAGGYKLVDYLWVQAKRAGRTGVARMGLEVNKRFGGNDESDVPEEEYPTNGTPNDNREEDSR